MCKSNTLNILLIDNYDSFTYNILAIVQELQVGSITIKKNDKVDIHCVSAFDFILISPGPSVPSQSGNIIPIIQAHGSRCSILGICLGHQAIAEAYGGRLQQATIPFHGYKTTLQQVQPHRLFTDMPNNALEVGLYHSWYVDEKTLPSCLQITSYSKENYIMSLKHKEYDIHGVQFHPESFMTTHGALYIKAWLEK